MGLQRRLINRLHLGVRLFPLDFTLCLFGIPTSVLSLIGFARSRALGVLPVWAELTWNVTLLVGCITWLIGIFSVCKIGEDTIIRKVELSIFGLTLVSSASAVYATAMVTVAGTNGLISATYLFAFAFGTWVRRVDLIDRAKGQDDT